MADAYIPNSVWNSIIQTYSNGEELTATIMSRPVQQIADNVQYLKDNKLSKNGDVLGNTTLKSSCSIDLNSVNTPFRNCGSSVDFNYTDIPSRKYVDNLLGTFIDNLFTQDGKFIFTFSNITSYSYLRLFQWSGITPLTTSTGYFYTGYHGAANFIKSGTALQWDNGAIAIVDSVVVINSYYQINYKNLSGVAPSNGTLYVTVSSSGGIFNNSLTETSDHRSYTIDNGSEHVLVSEPGTDKYLKITGIVVSTPSTNSAGTILSLTEGLSGTVMYSIYCAPGTSQVLSFIGNDIVFAENKPIVGIQSVVTTTIYVAIMTKTVIL